MKAVQQFDAIILGAGAAGLFCAGVAAQRGRRVVVLEHGPEVGRKILISGGGRCNFTNMDVRAENFLSANPHFAKSALARFRAADFVELVSKHKIPFHEKTLGQLFCDRSAKDILAMLVAEAAAAEIVTGCEISEVRRGNGFVVESSRGQFSSPALVVATGGLSIPKIGSTSFGYELGKQFGMRIEPTRPGLVPMLVEDCTPLAGVATATVVSIGKRSFREKMLFTHRGVSGPAMLQISSYWTRGMEMEADLLPGVELVEGTKAELTQHMPRRLADRWVGQLEEVHRWRFVPSGTEGYAKAEVTCGGVDTAGLSSKTMESRTVPGLFFVGEVVDVTGWLGGFNFQWAWASGWAAGMAV